MLLWTYGARSTACCSHCENTVDATMPEHIRSKAFKEFEAKLTKALAEGSENHFAAVQTLTLASITEFDQGHAGNLHLSEQYLFFMLP